MARDKQPQGGPGLAEYTTTATPKAQAGGVPVFCAHDAIVPTKDLQPNPKNPNQHPPEQIKALGAIIRATGWRGPITVSTRSGLIVKGHGRLMAAELEDLTEVPVDYQNYASEAEELADLTADNRIAELATTDNKLLAEVFADIDTGEIPFLLSGYTEEEYGNIVTALSEAIHRQELAEPDAVIEPPAAPVTQRGDLWILGKHRVVCGDCTNANDRALLLNGATPEILVTDPPYCSGGFQESGRSAGSIGTDRVDGNLPTIANDTLSTRGYQALMKAMIQDLPILVAYIFTDWRMWVYLFDIVESNGLGVKNMIVWNKKSPGMGVGWRTQHELVMFAHRTKPKFDNHKGYGNVLECTRTGNELHPTQKPVEIIEKLLDNTEWAHGVVDLFGGSGTTLIACEKMGQPSYLMELTPAFTDVIVKRYIRTTGKTDVRCVRQGKELPREAIAEIFEPDDEGGEQE
jgi:DNA modification methylase